MFLLLTFIVLHNFPSIVESYSIVGKSQENLTRNILRTNVHSINEIMADNNKQENQLKSHGINIDSIKQLVNHFPNHVIEIQIEMNEPPPKKIPFSKTRVMFNRNRPLPLVPTDEPSEYDRRPSPIIVPMMTTDFNERPVLMKDLMQVMKEFQNKLKVTTERNVFPMNLGRLSKNLRALMGRNNGNETQNEIVPQNGENEPTAKPSGSKKKVKDINDVLDLIKKGVKVQFDITKPTDNNLDWVQIRVPNKDINDSSSDGK